MRRWILLCFCAVFLSVVDPIQGSDLLPLPTPTITEESLFVRRIVEFWKDEDYALVKAQLKQFFSLYPQSEFSDGLYAILGDVYWNEGSFQPALDAYEHIDGNAYRQKVFSKRLDCLYQLKLFANLIESVRSHLPHDSRITPEQTLWVFYYAEALVQLAKNQSDHMQAQQLYRLARTSYESLLSTNHADTAKIALSEIYKALELPDEALACYLELAEKQPDNREELLFEAARIQAPSNPQQALATFSRIQEMGGKRAGDAAFWRIVLLSRQGRYEELIKQSGQWLELLTLQQQTCCHFLVGKSHAALNQHEEVLRHLQPLIDSFHEFKGIPADAKPNEKTILRLLISSAHQLNELALLKTWCQRYEAAFANDPALTQIWYFLALTNKNCDHFQEAQEILEKIIKNYPDFEKTDLVQLERTTLLFQQRKWEDCHQAGLNFLARYPEHEHRYQVHLLITLCCQQGVQDLDAYITHAEKALSIKPNGIESSSLHVGLFQAYLQKMQQTPNSSQEELNKAMEHLLAACAVKPDILQSLYKHYVSASETILRQQPQIIFSLAGVLQQTGASQQAQQLYTNLLRVKGIPPYIVAATQLNLARLSFSTLSSEQRSLENPELLKILQTLKDLQIRKVLIQEPVHLEAALEYAAIRSSLEPVSSQKEQLLFYLQRAKDEFTLSQDLCSKDYYASCQHYPEKALIYETYLLLFDAHIARLRGEIAHQEGHFTEGDESIANAQKLYTKVLQEPNISAHLIEKIRKQEI
jgi:tetratricopeptide (TPR) repeat protein